MRGMREASGGFEGRCCAGAALVMLLSTVAAAVLRPRLHLHNGRLQYGMEHLAGALLAAFLFTVLVGVAWRFCLRTTMERWLNRPTAFYLLLIGVVFCLFWLPPLLGGHFDEDDWQLLAAAAIRKAIYLHPGWSWYALDTVDGNFRPLGTVLYFGYLFRWSGLWPAPYFMGLFAVNLLGSLTVFFITREMGYSKVAGTAACLLFVSRSLTYEVRTWTSALGDALVILLCGGMAWALLRAIKVRGAAASGWHGLAWGCFALATLAKQSAFAAPLIVALLLLLRPGLNEIGPLWPRVRAAAAGLAVYGVTAAAVFFHAKSLARAEAPYPIGFSFAALLRTFSYAVWYLGTMELPSKHLSWLWVVPSVAGLGVTLGIGAAIWKAPRMLGERPRDVVFCLGAAVASLSLFVVLSNRQAAYYGAMAAFWISIAVGIALTRFRELRARRRAGFVFCVLLVTGFLDVRLKQTGLFPSGGYTWGTFTGSFAEGMYEGIARQLAAAPDARVLVLADLPGYPSHDVCMALLADPKLRTILTYDSAKRQFFANDLRGGRPRDGFAALNDVRAYNWTVPMDAAEAARIIGQGGVLWLKFEDGKIVVRD